MIINFRLDKVHSEKKNAPRGNIEAKNNLRVTNIEEESLSSLSKEKALNVYFSFVVEYQPKIANIEIEGSITYLTDQKVVKEILDNWQKNKKIKPEIAAPIFNYILSKCSVKALRLEEELELPFHIPIPKIKQKEEISSSLKAS